MAYQSSPSPHATNSASSYETEKSVVAAAGGLEPVPDHHNFPEAVAPYQFQGTAENLPPARPSSSGNGPLVCGLRRPTFILGILLAAVVIIAGVAGGVGGSMAVKKAYEYAFPTSTPHDKASCRILTR